MKAEQKGGRVALKKPAPVNLMKRLELDNGLMEQGLEWR